MLIYIDTSINYTMTMRPKLAWLHKFSASADLRRCTVASKIPLADANDARFKTSSSFPGVILRARELLERQMWESRMGDTQKTARLAPARSVSTEVLHA